MSAVPLPWPFIMSWHPLQPPPSPPAFAHLEEGGEDDSPGVTELKCRQQLWKDLMATEVFGEGIQVGAELLKELLTFGGLLNLGRGKSLDSLRTAPWGQRSLLPRK